MKKTMLRKPANFSDFALNLDQTKRPDAAPQEKQSNTSPGDFYWTADVFHVAAQASVNCSSYRQLDLQVMQSLKDHLIEFTASGQYAKSVVFRLVQAISASLAEYPTRSFNKPWLLRALTLASFRTIKGAAERFFLYWKDRYAAAITADALHHLVKTKLNVRRSGNAMSDDPEKSWLTDSEYDDLLQTIWQSYDANISGTQVAFMRLLSMQYARRPIQIALLKIGDFRDDEADEADKAGASGQRVCFPGAKDKLAETGFRDSKFEVHPIAEHLWDLFQIQRQEIKSLFETALKVSLNEDELKTIPLFSTVAQIKKAVAVFEDHYHRDWRENLGSEVFHMLPTKASRILSWESNASPYGHDEYTLNIAPPLSHRTGRPMVVSATRIRHTRARQLARLGMPKHVLSYWLGHTSNKSLDAYYNDPAEEARQINEAMGSTLMPMALAFTGKLIDDESHASRSNDPESRLEFANDGDLKSVGNCGKHSFCGTTSVPIPCYRCKHLEPLVYAPHDEVLSALLKRQAEEKEMIKIGGLRKLLVPIDLSADIRAVRTCIERCNARKAELEKS